MISIKRLVIMSVSLIAMNHAAHAEWSNPVVVLSGDWGSETNQFSFEHGDTEDLYPTFTDVSSLGELVIADELKGRIMLYRADGTHIRNIIPPVTDPTNWTLRPKFIGQNIVIPIKNYYFYSNTGVLLSQPFSLGRSIFKGELIGKLYVASVKPTKRWLVYSPDGILLNTYTEKPLELGRVSDQTFAFQGQLAHRVTVTFPGKEWVIAGPKGSCGEYAYMRDTAGNLYCVGEKNIKRYSICGKVVSEFTQPNDILTETELAPGVEPDITIVEGYGTNVMADNGDVYTSKVTPSNFSIIKWIWQNSPSDLIGEPDAPTEIISTVTGTEVTLKWTPSLQDPGCVSEYDITRATVATGPYTSVGKVVVGAQEYKDSTVQGGTAYYYKIDSVSAIGNSVDAKEVSVIVN